SEFEATDAAFGRAGEGAAFVAEDFAFHQGFGNRRAVDGDERAGGARRKVAELGAAISTMRMTSCIGFDAPTRSPRRPVSRNWRCKTASWRVSRAFSRQRSR